MKSIEYNSIFSELIQDFIDYKRATPDTNTNPKHRV